MVGALHDCIISDTVAKRFSRKDFDAEDDGENDNGTIPVAGLLPFVGGSQFAVEEFGGGAVSADPIAPAEQVVNFVGEN